MRWVENAGLCGVLCSSACCGGFTWSAWLGAQACCFSQCIVLGARASSCISCGYKHSSLPLKKTNGSFPGAIEVVSYLFQRRVSCLPLPFVVTQHVESKHHACSIRYAVWAASVATEGVRVFSGSSPPIMPFARPSSPAPPAHSARRRYFPCLPASSCKRWSRCLLPGVWSRSFSRRQRFQPKPARRARPEPSHWPPMS